MSSPNYTRDAVEQFYWCFAEVNLGIICAAAPALKPFVMRYVPSLLRSGLSSSGRGTKSRSEVLREHKASAVDERKRRVMQAESYELRSRDDLAERIGESAPRESTSGDEAKLWMGDDQAKEDVGAKNVR